MKIKIQNFEDIKALAILKKMSISDELPKVLGYKSLWGLKTALKNPRKKDEILKKARSFFLGK